MPQEVQANAARVAVARRVASAAGPTHGGRHEGAGGLERTWRNWHVRVGRRCICGAALSAPPAEPISAPRRPLALLDGTRQAGSAQEVERGLRRERHRPPVPKTAPKTAPARIRRRTRRRLPVTVTDVHACMCPLACIRAMQLIIDCMPPWCLIPASPGDPASSGPRALRPGSFRLQLSPTPRTPRRPGKACGHGDETLQGNTRRQGLAAGQSYMHAQSLPDHNSSSSVHHTCSWCDHHPTRPS